jgi:hypothetical protein
MRRGGEEEKRKKRRGEEEKRKRRRGEREGKEEIFYTIKNCPTSKCD